jgi:hypothetical protein
MTEGFVTFKDLKIGERFVCEGFDPARDALTVRPKDISEYTKTGPDTVEYKTPSILQFIFGGSLGFKFPPDVQVKRLDVTVCPKNN